MIKLIRAAACAAALLMLEAPARAIETTWIYSVQLSAAVQGSPARIELRWPADHLPVASYTIYRKAPSDATWPAEGVTISGDSTSFVDDAVEDGRTYEYQVVKRGAGYTGYGYILAALNAPLVESRGRVILVVDNSIAGPLGNELAVFEQDLVGDGWTVSRRDVARDASPASVRDTIRGEYNADRARTKAVILVGHVPVVRSGNLNVDGHRARPMPADVFYGEMDGNWTDANGDGVYDQSLLPSDVELQVGRIDFADLPGQFAAAGYPGEVDLLRRYLAKNHAYRHAATRPIVRALVGGTSDANGQAYAAAAYRNFAATVGADKVTTIAADDSMPTEERWITRITRDDYLFVYGQGAGSDFTISNLGTHGQYNDVWSTDFVDQKARGTFYLLFGSWFSDWAQPDNLLRSALASPDAGLGAAWSGRPHLFLHAMGAGETIGYGVRLSQNNDGTLYRNQVQRQLRGIHIALLGDPTLRLYAVAPPSDPNVSLAGNDVVLTWRPSRDDIRGYYVYRASSPAGPFTRITDAPIGEARFVDAGRAAEGATYLIRAVTLQGSPSGAFFNASQGAFATNGGGTLVATSTPPAAPAPAPAPETPRDAVEIAWVDDALPPGASPFATTNDRWNWVTGVPAPASGALAHLSEAAVGLHYHFFVGASQPLRINAGDRLFVYVFIDPNNPPRSLAISWLADNWEHRAYWGEDLFTEGTEGAASRKRVGSLPAAGRWERIEVPAAAVGLEGRDVTGMGFMLFDGRVSWDRAGKVGR